MSEADREIQAAARAFVDELLPHEVEAELHGGELPAELLGRRRRRVGELGFEAINMPKELGGGFSAFQQVLVQEQVGRATNALGWVIHTPASWLPQVATDEQLERWVLPTIRGERRECYAITEEGAGSDVDAIQATAHRDGDGYRLDGVKWHVTSFNHADHVFFQAKLAAGPNAGAHAMFVVDLDTPGIRVLRTPAYSHTIPYHHPVVAFEDVRVPAGQLVGEEGDGMRFAYEWFRYERLMIAARCLGAAERLIEEATAFARQRPRLRPADPRLPGDPVHAGRLAHRAVGGAADDLPHRPRHRRRPRRQGAARPVLHGQAVRLGDGRARRRPGGAGVRRPRLHARERGRALLPGAAGGAHLGGHLGDPADDRRRPARQAGRRPADRIGGRTR
jgi:alkylation response protein AidB-like acyl-CoA dehydrogenase